MVILSSSVIPEDNQEEIMPFRTAFIPKSSSSDSHVAILYKIFYRMAKC